MYFLKIWVFFIFLTFPLFSIKHQTDHLSTCCLTVGLSTIIKMYDTWGCNTDSFILFLTPPKVRQLWNSFMAILANFFFLFVQRLMLQCNVSWRYGVGLRLIFALLSLTVLLAYSINSQTRWEIISSNVRFWTCSYTASLHFFYMKAASFLSFWVAYIAAKKQIYAIGRNLKKMKRRTHIHAVGKIHVEYFRYIYQ